MKGYADTGFLGSLFMEETTSEAAGKALARHGEPLPLTTVPAASSIATLVMVVPGVT